MIRILNRIVKWYSQSFVSLWATGSILFLNIQSSELYAATSVQYDVTSVEIFSPAGFKNSELY